MQIQWLSWTMVPFPELLQTDYMCKNLHFNKPINWFLLLCPHPPPPFDIQGTCITTSSASWRISYQILAPDSSSRHTRLLPVIMSNKQRQSEKPPY
ncbi:tubulin gamma chain [Histoplasma ohiense]|nr:tubulin gamma chain [Histoplasma ohiense (nom. inval.)]